MNNPIARTLALSTAIASGIFAQSYQRQASMVGGGGPDRGKCTVEVVVDDVAQVEIRGTTATLRNISGQPAQWRRFECTGALPPNPGNFHFAGVDGRGRQELVRDPRNGGVAVVQIEDKDGGAEGYTFDITWGSDNRGGYARNDQERGYPTERGPAYGGVDRYPDRAQEPGRPNYRDGDYYRRYHHEFGVDEAVRQCQLLVSTQAARRFHSQDIHFHRTALDDRPGRNDWVTGTLDVYRGNHEERFGFSCSVDFMTGRVRSADLDARPLPDDPRWH